MMECILFNAPFVRESGSLLIIQEAQEIPHLLGDFVHVAEQNGLALQRIGPKEKSKMRMQRDVDGDFYSGSVCPSCEHDWGCEPFETRLCPLCRVKAMDEAISEGRKIAVMNSAMMPDSGLYRCDGLDREDFAKYLCRYREALASYIGYQQNLDLIKEWTEGQVDLPICNALTVLEPGDFALVMRLNYRAPKGSKGRPVNEGDFSFFLVNRQA